MKWVARLADGVFLRGGSYDPDYDPQVESLSVLDRHPDPRLERSDGQGGVRPATSPEIAAYDDQIKSAQAGRRTDDLVVLALGAFVLREVNALRAAVVPPKPALTAQDLRTFVVDFIKVRL